MTVHLDVLGWLHVLAGWVGLLTGAAFLLLAAGAASLAGSAPDPAGLRAVMWLLFLVGAVLVPGGWVMMATGRGLVARRLGARRLALLLALPSLCALPFGTALGAYTLWALLNDDARRAFGRPLRGGAAA